MVKAFLPTFVVVALLGLTGGCLEFEQQFLILPDGSAEITLNYSLEEARLANLATGQAAIEELQGAKLPTGEPANLNWMFNEEAVRRFFTGEGIKLERYITYTRNDRKVVQAACTVKNLRKTLSSGKFGDFTLKKNPAGNWVFHMDLPVAENGATPDDARIRELKTLCRGMKLKLAVETPSELLASSGNPKVDGHQAVWLFEPARDDTFLRQPPAVEVIFSGAKLNWPE